MKRAQGVEAGVWRGKVQASPRRSRDRLGGTHDLLGGDLVSQHLHGLVEFGTCDLAVVVAVPAAEEVQDARGRVAQRVGQLLRHSTWLTGGKGGRQEELDSTRIRTR